MVDSKIQHADVAGAAQSDVQAVHATQGDESRPTLADRLAAGLSEFFTRRRQNRPGIYAPLVRVERTD